MCDNSVHYISILELQAYKFLKSMQIVNIITNEKILVDNTIKQVNSNFNLLMKRRCSLLSYRLVYEIQYYRKEEIKVE